MSVSHLGKVFPGSKGGGGEGDKARELAGLSKERRVPRIV